MAWACSSSHGPALLLKLSGKGALETSALPDERSHALPGLAGACPPLSVSDCHWLCQELPLPPAAAQSFAGICCTCTTLSSNSTTGACRCFDVVFIEKQTLGLTEAISSKHTLLETDVTDSACTGLEGSSRGHQAQSPASEQGQRIMESTINSTTP